MSGDDGDDFLSLVEAAEAEASATLSSKRLKFSSAAAHRPELPSPPAEEGSYMAALRGSHSSIWKQQQEEQKLVRRKTNIGGAGSILSGPNYSVSGNLSKDGACFKCGMTGHWSRDCSIARKMDIGGGEGAEVPVKACPCGLGNCLVLTSSTAKNPGRKFYRCPLKVDNGGCNFFEWCDNPVTNVSTRTTPHNQANKRAADFVCPCGAGSCIVLVAKTGSNFGRRYYQCPAEGNASCGFFKWCSDEVRTTSQSTLAMKYHGTTNYSSSQSSSERASSACFKCGQEGHWSRDCSQQSSDTCVTRNATQIASSASRTCFKCGKSGHWAPECATQDFGSSTCSFKAYKAS